MPFGKSLRFHCHIGIAVILALGCGQGKPVKPPIASAHPQPEEVASPTAQVISQKTVVAETPQPAGLRKGDQSPVAAVLKVTAGLQNGRLEELWRFLPKNCQRDLLDLVRTAASRTDAEVWGASRELLRKSRDVLRTRKAFLLGSAWLQAPENAAWKSRLTTDWDASTQLVELLTESRWSDRAAWQTMNDLQPVLDEVANPVIQRLGFPAQWQGFANLRVALVSGSDDRATLKLSVPPHSTGQEVLFRYSDGHWVPEPLLEEWPRQFAAMKQQLQGWTPERWTELKPQLLQELQQGSAWLDALLAAQTQEQFDAAFTPGLLNSLQVVKRWDRLRIALFPKSEPRRIEVRLTGRFTAAQGEELLRKLIELTDQPATAIYTAIPQEEGLLIYLTSVRDLDRFQKGVSFGQVTASDPARGQIQITVTVPDSNPR